LDNIEIELLNKTPFGSVNKLDFAMKVIAIDDVYKKQISVNISVKNPWEDIDIDNNELNNVTIEEDEELNIDLENMEIEEDENTEVYENLQIKDNLKNQNLITIYNYEEL
jgi:hypothetical protein